MEITTIKLKKETKSRLDKLKIHEKESYDSLMKKILEILNICKFNPEEARVKLKKIDAIRNLSERK